MRCYEPDGGHDYHICEHPDCYVCRGGLASCEVCKGGEASLPTECPGEAMTSEQQDAVQEGTLDFINGEWKHVV